MMKAYRKERIEECLSVLRGEKRMKGGWGELVRQIHAVAEVLETPDAEMAESAQERGEKHIVDVNNMIPGPALKETPGGKDRGDRMIPWVKFGFRKWGTA